MKWNKVFQQTHNLLCSSNLKFPSTSSWAETSLDEVFCLKTHLPLQELVTYCCGLRAARSKWQGL